MFELFKKDIMKDSVQNQSNIKEKIINTTISLIERSDGLVENITVRDIAQKKSDVAIGLINYHFGSKENLIKSVFSRMISMLWRLFPKQVNSSDKEDVHDKKKTLV